MERVVFWSKLAMLISNVEKWMY